MHGLAGKLFIAVLLALCAVVYALEMSGRWDRSIQDANDEAGLVAIVLCIGVAVSVAGSVITRIRASRIAARIALDALTTPLRFQPRRTALLACMSGPPLSLRI